MSRGCTVSKNFLLLVLLTRNYGFGPVAKRAQALCRFRLVVESENVSAQFALTPGHMESEKV